MQKIIAFLPFFLEGVDVLNNGKWPLLKIFGCIFLFNKIKEIAK